MARFRLADDWQMREIKTPVCDVLGIDVPIVQAPIGSATTPALVAAVSNAGALGVLSVTWRSPDEIRRLIRQTKQLTNRPFAINLVLEWSQTERLAACLEEGVPIISFFWGDPSPYMSAVRDAGAVSIHAVGSIGEARLARDAGVDVIVAQGSEAGGHVRGVVSTMVLVPRVVDAVTPKPVLAAGGIADGRTFRAALALGAQGVWIGSRFLASDEASIHPLYKKSVVTHTEDDTIATTLFDIGWPGAPHRVIRNSTVETWLATGSPPAGKRPGEGESVARTEAGHDVLRYSDSPPQPGMSGDVEALPMYAGQSIGLVGDIAPAGEIIRRLVDDATKR